MQISRLEDEANNSVVSLGTMTTENVSFEMQEFSDLQAKTAQLEGNNQVLKTELEATKKALESSRNECQEANKSYDTLSNKLKDEQQANKVNREKLEEEVERITEQLTEAQSKSCTIL